MPHVVILGGGFAGLSAAKEFERRLRRKRDLRVTLVDRQNYMLFTPMLPEAASGSVEGRSIAQPFRAQLRRVGFELGDVLGVDTQRRDVHLRHPLTHDARTLHYDELLIALGSTGTTFGIDGVERCTLALRTLADAERIRNAIVGAMEVAARTRDVVERDRLTRIVIVGGGFTGVEAAGELRAFTHSVLKYYPELRDRGVDFVLVQREGRLLPHLPAKFGKYAARVLAGRGIRILTNAAVSSVDDSGIELHGGERIASRTIVWAAGTEPSPLSKRLGLKTSKHGAIEVSRDFRIPGHDHLWAIGDTAAVPKAGGGTYAPLAQNAVREGPLAARNILGALRGRSTKPFRYRDLGQMASLGDRHAMAELPGGAMLTGLPAWLLWRGYYLGRLPSLSRRARVAADWTLGAAFPPGLARLPLVERGEVPFEAFHATRK